MMKHTTVKTILSQSIVSKSLTILCFSLVLILAGCADKRYVAAQLPANVTIGLVAFTQPSEPKQLLSGYIPDNQHLVSSKEFSALDNNFLQLLSTKTTRVYLNLGSETYAFYEQRPANKQSIFDFWVALGRKANVDLLLVPQVIDLVERGGGDLGANTPAGIFMDIYLINVRTGEMVARSHYKETQESLSDNFFNIAKFFSRSGRWVTAQELAQEGMFRAIEELGL